MFCSKWPTSWEKCRLEACWSERCTEAASRLSARTEPCDEVRPDMAVVVLQTLVAVESMRSTWTNMQGGFRYLPIIGGTILGPFQCTFVKNWDFWTVFLEPNNCDCSFKTKIFFAVVALWLWLWKLELLWQWFWDPILALESTTDRLNWP